MNKVVSCIKNIDLLLAWGATFHKLEKGRVIFCEGDKPVFYYQIVSGKVKMCNTNEDGKEFIQGIFEDGESFGEPPLFDNSCYPASAVAETETTIIRLRKENFLQLLRDNFDIHFCFTSMLAARLRYKSVISKALSIHNPAHRITTLLLEIKSQYGLSDCNKMKIELTRQQIADMTGLRVETVIRSIRQLEDEGRLRIERGKVYF